MKIFNAIGRLISNPLLAAVMCVVGGPAIWYYSQQPPAGAPKLGGEHGTAQRTIVDSRPDPLAGGISRATKTGGGRNSPNTRGRIAAQTTVTGQRDADFKENKQTDVPPVASTTAAADRPEPRPPINGGKSTSASPESVLESRGLKKKGMFYLVDTEGEIHKGYNQIVPIFTVMEDKYNQFVAIGDAEATFEYLDNERILAETRIRDIDIEIPGLGKFIEDQMRRNQLLVERRDVTRYLSDVNGSLAIVRKKLVPFEFKQRVHDEFMKFREDFFEANKQLLPTVKKAANEYNGLKNDPAVTDAVKVLADRTKLPEARALQGTVDRDRQIEAGGASGVVQPRRIPRQEFTEFENEEKVEFERRSPVL